MKIHQGELISGLVNHTFKKLNFALSLEYFEVSGHVEEYIEETGDKVLVDSPVQHRLQEDSRGGVHKT